MSRDQLQQKELDATQGIEAMDVDVDVEHKPEVARRASNAGLGRAAVQMKGGSTNEGVQEAAERGKQAPATAMPHADTIQRAFGAHDISGIQAHTGEGSASEMGAEAYATGDHVMFGDTAPDLHTAAHEAAHVVQQKRGVNLAGGVGQVGDAHERNADAIADRVVAGESAEDLLGPASGGQAQADGQTVQRKEHKESTPEEKKSAHDTSDSASAAAVTSSLQLFAKRLHEATREIQKQMAGPFNTDAGSAPAQLEVDRIYQSLLKEAMHVGDLLKNFHLDKTMLRFMAPEVKQCVGAYRTFEPVMNKGIKFIGSDGTARNPDFIWSSVSQFAAKIGYSNDDLGMDSHSPEGTETSVRSTAVTDHLNGAIGAAKSVKTGNTGDADRLAFHVTELSAMKKQEAGALKGKAHQGEVAQLKALLKDLEKSNPELVHPLLEQLKDFK